MAHISGSASRRTRRFRSLSRPNPSTRSRDLRARHLLEADGKAVVLFDAVVERGLVAGWAFDGPHSGHLVGELPHDVIDREREIGGFVEHLLTLRRE